MTKAYYDSYNYPDYWIGREYENEAEKIALNKLLKLIPQGDSIIDIGGGFGRHAQLYTKIFKKCLLVDPSKKLLDIAQKNIHTEGFKTKQGTGESLPVKDHEFNVAIMVRVTHHINDPYLVFKEAARVLKPGGFFIIEYANKIHIRAVLRSWLKGNFSFQKNTNPIDQRTLSSKTENTITFLNHHPEIILKKLEDVGFTVCTGLSVSNFRSSLLKKVIPTYFLLLFEKLTQHFLYPLHFGPSIFLLVQKRS